MADNLFSGLPPPSSSQQQELPISPKPDDSKIETSSSAPTLVLKSALKRSKPQESAPNVSGTLNLRTIYPILCLCYLNSIPFGTVLIK